MAVERLLSISGEDVLTVDRKYREPWSGQLPTRFLIMTNIVPRFSPLVGCARQPVRHPTMTVPFFGREDPTLTGKLLKEIDGIFNWALEGLDRLRARGYFDIPASSRDALRHLEDLSSPIGASSGTAARSGPSMRSRRTRCGPNGRTGASPRGVRCRDQGRVHAGPALGPAGLKPRKLRDDEKRTPSSTESPSAKQWMRPGDQIPDQTATNRRGPGSGPE